MVNTKFVRACLRVFLGFLWFNGVNGKKINDAIPELPMEERQVNSDFVVENKPEVLKQERSFVNPGFFSDNAQSRGIPRYLNALEISGYLRTRFNYFRNASLGTYIPEIGRGTSNFLPNLSLLEDAKNNDEKNPAQNNFSGNMRLRLDPTINVSEVVRIKSTLDVFDNLVLGSTPSYMYLHAPNPSTPVSLMSMSQNPPMVGINSLNSAIMLKRVWGEASFPVGELRFGRMPFHWGLGILYNSGDDITNDYGDQIDGILFSTKIMDHIFTPGYSIAYTGPLARGGGFFRTDPNHPSVHVTSELGQRYPLEVSDLTHVFFLSILKRDSEVVALRKRESNKASFEYGLLGSYRHQSLDSNTINPNPTPLALESQVKRDGNVGLASWWMALNYKTLAIETEFAGIFGKYKVGQKPGDLLGQKEEDIKLLSGGLALKSKYGFLNDRLQIGLDAGLASSSKGAGFGIREGANANPQSGEADGKKFTHKGYKTNFNFNPAYNVDLLMYREVLGTVSGSYYLKPHISYFFSRNFGVRGDVINSFALDKENTTGNSPFLGMEFDASTFLRTDDGFYFSLAYGVLFPFKGLSHQRSNISTQNYDLYGQAKTAQTLQFYFGLLF